MSKSSFQNNSIQNLKSQINETILIDKTKFNGSLLVDENLTRIEVVLLTSLFVLTILGNLIVILILFLYRNLGNGRSTCFSLNKNISRMSFYIIHLSIADINVALMSILPQIIWRSSILFDHSQFLCKTVAFSQVFSVYVSTFLLIVMAYDRFKCICWPIKSCSWTYKNASIGIISSWLLAALVSSPQLILFKIQKMDVKNMTIETCYVKWSSKANEGSYIIYHFSTQFLIPLIVLIFLYTKIFLIVSKNISYKNASINYERDNSFSTERISNIQLDKSKNTSEISMCNKKKTSKSIFSFLINFRHRMWHVLSRNKKNQNIKFNSTNNNSKQSLEMRPMITKTESYSLIENNIINNGTRQKNSFKSIKDMPIRQNWPAKALTKSKMKTLKLTLTVVIAYVLCSLPFYVSLIVNFFLEKTSKDHSNRFDRFLINMLYQLNSCANPFIYMIFNGNACNIIKKNRKMRKSSTKNTNVIDAGTLMSENFDANFNSRRFLSIPNASYHKQKADSVNNKPRLTGSTSLNL